MKKLIKWRMLIPALLLSLVFTACKSDDDSPIDDSPITDGNKLNGHEFVDLGLPSKTKWATCNLDATSIYDVGSKYAWGETSPKSNSNWDNYMTKEGFRYLKEGREIVIINDPLKDYVYPNNKSIAGTEYDAATANWGKGWTTPTLDQVQELINNCSINYIEEGEALCCEFVGPNGNSIYLPLDERMECIYWTSSPSYYGNNNSYDRALYAYSYCFDFGKPIDIGDEFRYKIRSIAVHI